MPTAQFVYPSAKHTRKTHSLGVMQLVHESILNLLFLQYRGIKDEISPLFWGEKVVQGDQIERNLDDLYTLREDWWNQKSLDNIVQSARLAGMLHDLGHAPLSHLFEDICRLVNVTIEYKGKKEIFDHEVMTRKIIEEKEDELGIKRPFSSQDVIEILDKKDGRAPLFLRELINGGYDCDKMDYLLRDSYATGALEFGHIDYKRIICGFRVVDESLKVSVSAIDALMNSFDALEYMYTSVYYHKTARIFDFMIEDALSKIPDFLQLIVEDTDKFLQYDDHNFIREAIEYAEKNKNDENKDVPNILKDLLCRRKKYVEIFSHRLACGYLLVERTRNELENLKNELNEIAKNLEIRVDFKPEIKPIGISIEEIPTWLLEERIYDPSDGLVKSIRDVSRAYYQKLKQYTILFRIFANRAQLDPSTDTKNIYRNEKEKIVRVAKEKLSEIETMYEEF